MELGDIFGIIAIAMVGWLIWKDHQRDSKQGTGGNRGTEPGKHQK